MKNIFFFLLLFIGTETMCFAQHDSGKSFFKYWIYRHKLVYVARPPKASKTEKILLKSDAERFSSLPACKQEGIIIRMKWGY